MVHVLKLILLIVSSYCDNTLLKDEHIVNCVQGIVNC